MAAGVAGTWFAHKTYFAKGARRLPSVFRRTFSSKKIRNAMYGADNDGDSGTSAGGHGGDASDADEEEGAYADMGNDAYGAYEAYEEDEEDEGDDALANPFASERPYLDPSAAKATSLQLQHRPARTGARAPLFGGR